MNFAKFLRAPILIEHLWWLLLLIVTLLQLFMLLSTEKIISQEDAK